jgi:hypothetical protein
MLPKVYQLPIDSLRKCIKKVPNVAMVFSNFIQLGLPVNGDGAGKGEGDGVTCRAITAHPVGGGCRPIPVHIAAVFQQAVRRVVNRVPVHGGGHRGFAAAYCTKYEKIDYLLL